MRNICDMLPVAELHNNITRPATWPWVHLIPPSVTVLTVSFLIQSYFEGSELYNYLFVFGRTNKSIQFPFWKRDPDPYFLLLLLCLDPRRDSHNLLSWAVAGSGAATSQLSSSLSPPSVAVGISDVVVLWWPFIV